MDFNYTDEQSMLADAVGRWLAADYGFARRRRLASGEESWDGNWRHLADLGLLGLNVPEDQGGMGGTSVAALIVMQALGRALVVEPYVQTALVSAPLLARAGSQEQRNKLLPQIVAGDARVVVATLEPGARFDLDHIETRAVSSGAGYVLSGRKAVAVGAESAHYLIVSARTSGAGRDMHGISLFLVPADAAGVAVRATPTIDGLHAAEVTLNDVVVSADALVGPLHDAFLGIGDGERGPVP